MRSMHKAHGTFRFFRASSRSMDGFAETRLLCGFMIWRVFAHCYEAMQIECSKYAAPEEIFWRVVLQSARF